MNMNREEIMKVIPHRDPFLLVDRVEDLIPGESGTGFYTVPESTFWTKAHFPDYPVMPGHLISEALAQLGACVILSHEDNVGKVALLAREDGPVSWRGQVRPGDELRMEVEITKLGRLSTGSGRVFVVACLCRNSTLPLVKILGSSSRNNASDKTVPARGFRTTTCSYTDKTPFPQID